VFFKKYSPPRAQRTQRDFFKRQKINTVQTAALEKTPRGRFSKNIPLCVLCVLGGEKSFGG
jgi:hypothetical protein